MASELVHSATNGKLSETDWTKNIEICELVARGDRQAKDVVKAIKKRLGSKKPNTQLYAVTLLEMLMNNIGDPVHKQVVDSGILPLLVKIVKKKSDSQVREKIFLLLDAAQTSVGGANGRFPQYYASYYELVSAGVQFPQISRDLPKTNSTANLHANNNESKKESTTLRREMSVQEKGAQAQPPESRFGDSIFQKAGTALEVLRDVLDTIDTERPEGAIDEFTLDLVEQCSFQKQRVMHLAVTSRDEKVITRAIELNDQLERVLRRHDALLSHTSLSTSNHVDHREEEKEEEDVEEEAEQLFRRMRKGKACVRPQDEEDDRHEIMGGRSLPGNIINRPLIRTIPGEPSPVIPPPPAKHAEREKFFRGKNDGSGLNGLHARNLSLHSVNAASSRSGCSSTDDLSSD